ncbi:MAG: hypothetical protein ACRDZO_01620 [Egibacteraceae bacterium]
MNRSVTEVGGSVLAITQFTLYTTPEGVHLGVGMVVWQVVRLRRPARPGRVPRSGARVSCAGRVRLWT